MRIRVFFAFFKVKSTVGSATSSPHNIHLYFFDYWPLLTNFLTNVYVYMMDFPMLSYVHTCWIFPSFLRIIISNSLQDLFHLLPIYIYIYISHILIKRNIDSEINSNGLRFHSSCYISSILHTTTWRKKILNQIEIDEILSIPNLDWKRIPTIWICPRRTKNTKTLTLRLWMLEKDSLPRNDVYIRYHRAELFMLKIRNKEAPKLSEFRPELVRQLIEEYGSIGPPMSDKHQPLFH